MPAFNPLIQVGSTIYHKYSMCLSILWPGDVAFDE